MSAHGGPNIDNTGLVFVYDMNNTNKSWKGAPTTNLANVSLNGMSGVSLTYLGMDGDWKKYSMSGTFTGGTYPFILSITAISFTGGTTYSSSCYIKTSAISKFNYFGTGMNYVNQPMTKSGASFSILQDDGSFYIGRSNFAYTSTTTQTGYILSNPINNTVFNSSTDFVWIKDGQIELGEFPTPFAGNLSTRSNSQSLLDLAGNNTITVDSLTYNSDGTFSFNNSSTNYISLPNSIGYSTNGVSVFAWFKRNGVPSSGYHIICGGQELEISIPEPGGSLRVGVYTNVRYVSNHGSGLLDGNWHYIGFTLDGTTKTAYIDGNSVGTQTVSGTLTSSFANRRIGTFGSGTDYLANASIPKYTVHNRTLSAAEVLQNYYAVKGRFIQ